MSNLHTTLLFVFRECLVCFQTLQPDEPVELCIVCRKTFHRSCLNMRLTTERNQNGSPKCPYGGEYMGKCIGYNIL
jgi:hypothetical protein